MSDASITRLRRLARQIRHIQACQIRALVVDKFCRLLGPHLTAQHVVLRFDQAVALPVRFPENFELLRCNDINDIPARVADSAEFAAFADVFEANFREGGVVWLGLVEGRLATSHWTITRNRLRQWYVRVEPEDLILYSVVTRPEYRGRGLAGEVAGEIFRQESDRHGAFYVDCKRWNRTAQRAFVKAGFRPIAISPPLPDIST